MNSFQRTVKYIAMAFAIVLAIGIVSGIVNIVFAILSVITGSGFEEREGKIDFSKTFTDVRSLDIDYSSGRLIIQRGDTFQVVAENIADSFEAKVTGNGTLEISDEHRDDKFFWFHIKGITHPDSRITIYLPEDFVADKAVVETGTGSVKINGLETAMLTVTTGAGNITCEDISAQEARIESGAGSVILKDVNLSDADLECGVGSMKIEGLLLGKSMVECGVGGVVMDLSGNTDDYDMDINTGLGSRRLNGKRIPNEYIRDNHADNSLMVDCGIGSVRIDITE